MDCFLSTAGYFAFKQQILNDLTKLKGECPNLVMEYLLRPESPNRIRKITTCEYSDKFDKAIYNESRHVKNCKKLEYFLSNSAIKDA